MTTIDRRTTHPSLFESRALHHRNDPASSVQAAQVTVSSGRAANHGERVLQAVRLKPWFTSGELAEMVDGLDLTEVRRRLTGLKNQGLIIQGGIRHCECSACKTLQVTWYALEGS